jgi:hypothetical protein
VFLTLTETISSFLQISHSKEKSPEVTTAF